jgi:hypothetical protein
MGMSEQPSTPAESERDVAAARMGAPATLDAVWDDLWQRLEAAVTQRDHAFRTAVLATVGEDGADARTVVLRHVDRQRACLRFHSDARSTKLAQIEHDERVCLVFYGEGVQVRLRGMAQICADPVAAEAWTRTGTMSRRCYLTIDAPGTPIHQPASGLPAAFESSRPPLAESESGRARFAVVEVEVASLDWLHLAADGQRRAGFGRSGDGWISTWLVP